MPNNDERHYKSSKLNLLFTIASVALLLALVGMFIQDHDRDWKHYQREFNQLDKEITEGKLFDEVEEIESSEEFKKLTKEVTAQKTLLEDKSGEMAAFEKNYTAKLTALELTTQKYQFAKAQYDSDKYIYETALGHQSSEADSLEEALNALKKDLDQLTLDKQAAEVAAKSVEKSIAAFEKEVTELERSLRRLTLNRDVLERKLTGLDNARMSFLNRIAAFVRNQPMLDMLNPSVKIDQIVLKDLEDDVHFMGVPKVERCTTCHQGIANSDFKDAPQPFTTHPNLELFLSSSSKHPIEEFGCTSCHDGRGRGTTFTSASHTPANEEQKKEWQEKHNWEEMHHWESPMRPKQYVEAGCLKCHAGQTVIPGAEKLNLGLNLIEKAGCYSCHQIDKFEGWPKAGPDLKQLASKSAEAWVYKWIQDPESFRHNTWMPSFFNQSNTNDPESIKRTDQEIHAMTKYLFENSAEFEKENVPFKGNSEVGKELIVSLGCYACHEMEEATNSDATTRESLREEHGPNLIGLASKTSPEWLYNWLKDPTRYHPETQMPNLRLSDEEASNITAFLTQSKNAAFDGKPIANVDDTEITNIVTDFLKKSMPIVEAKEKAAAMPLNEKLVFAGEKLIRHYGCAGCHNIPGFENEKPVGTELSEEGSKPALKLDFGNVHEIGHHNYSWFDAKLKNPRIFDRDKVKDHYDKLKMPNFHFTDLEAEAITTALLGLVKEKPSPTKMVPRTPENLAIEEGQKVVRQMNCQSCHAMEGEGGNVQESVRDWLITYEEKTDKDADALKASFSPPNLIGEGKKVQADWLFEFIHSPEVIRPWLQVRMPTFNLTDEQTNTLIEYFAALDGENLFESTYDPALTPEEITAGEQLFSSDYFGCVQCHIVGDKMPEGSPENWAPNFALAHERLKSDWVVDWLKDPQALLPGTKMPTFFDANYFDVSGPDDILDGDENRQIEVMRDYMIHLGKSKPNKSQPTEKANLTTNTNS